MASRLWSSNRSHLLDRLGLHAVEWEIPDRSEEGGRRSLCDLVPILHRFAMRRELAGLQVEVVTEGERSHVVVRAPERKDLFFATFRARGSCLCARIPGISADFWRKTPAAFSPGVVEAALDRSFASWRAEGSVPSPARRESF